LIPLIGCCRVPLDAGEVDSTRRSPRIPLDASEDLFARRRPRIPLDTTGDDLTTFLRQDATDEVLSTHHGLRPSTPRDAGLDHSTRQEPCFELDAGDDLTTFLRPYATDKDLSTQDKLSVSDFLRPSANGEDGSEVKYAI
jgi:hypothetical protein